MRSIIGLSIASLLFIVTGARAQYPGNGGVGPGYGGGGGYGNPGLYGGGLSPYLNMRGVGGSAASNCYNFVRPYTGGTFGNAFAPIGGGMPAVRRPLFPNARSIYDEDPATQKVEADRDGVMRAEMPPAGHGAGFMNQMGFFGATGGSGPGATAGRRPR